MAQPSNRARVRSALERKPVFKSVLESPFHINWPPLPPNVQNVILARLVAALDNVPQRLDSSRKIPKETGRQKNPHNTDGLRIERGESQVSSASEFVIGINAVTRALEYQLHVMRRHVVQNAPQNGAQPSPIAVVFICSADLDPPALVDHLLHLVAGCNSPKNVAKMIKLVPLPQGSEQTISQALGLRRAAALAFRHGSPSLETFQDILDSVPTVTVPWLSFSDTRDIQQLVPTHIKQLRTIAPKDMKSAKEQRSGARAAAKKNVPGSLRSLHRKARVRLTTATQPRNAEADKIIF